MPRIRLFVQSDLATAAAVELAGGQAHYLRNVMRAGPGDEILVFNGRDGEWRAAIAATAKCKASVRLEIGVRTREQSSAPDLWLAFAPVKRGPLEMIAGKACELGVSALIPVITARTNIGRVRFARLQTIAAEAAEQCGRLDVPEIRAPVDLAVLLADWPTGRTLIFCDESGGGTPIAEALAGADPAAAWAVLVGPEGGFEKSELEAIAKLHEVMRVGLGPRILRAETAAIAALACWQALVGERRP